MSTIAHPPGDTLMVKTAKGSAEISTREHRLGPRLRTILIMVDGRLTLAELAARAATFGNAPAIVDHLLNEGFIEPKTAAAAPAPPPPPADPMARTVRMTTLDFQGGVDDATRSLVTELTRSGNLMTLRGDSLAGMRENEAINPAKFFMRETISRLLGGGAVGVLDAIDQATTHERVLVELANCWEIIKDLKGLEEADSFRISVMALLPE